MQPVTIASLCTETRNVKLLTLDLGEHSFDFLPGQWIDCYLRPEPDSPVAGYSMTSSPRENSHIQIAVKLVGDNPVTHHIHRAAEIGDPLFIDGGHGDFYYTPNMSRSVVLLGGGIGITPLMSMLRVAAEAPDGPNVTLLYSAKTHNDLAFRRDIDEIAQQTERVEVHYTITGVDPNWRGTRGRIDRKMLSNVLLDTTSTVYICGPTPFIKFVEAELLALGIPRFGIHYELWN